MKGAQGLIVAVILGALGVALNWLYLDSKARYTQTLSFVGIKNDVALKPGDMINEDHLVEVEIPMTQAKTLRDFVFPYDSRSAIIGTRATRAMTGGEFIYRHDYRTPPPELELKEGEQLIWVPVDGSGFVPSLLNPGDEISFLIPTGERALPPGGEARPMPEAGAGQTIPLTSVEEVGPFIIKTLGNRLTSADLMRLNQTPQVQEREIGIIIKQEKGKLEAKAARLIDLLARSNRRNISIKLNQRGTRG